MRAETQSRTSESPRKSTSQSPAGPASRGLPELKSQPNVDVGASSSGGSRTFVCSTLKPADDGASWASHELPPEVQAEVSAPNDTIKPILESTLGVTISGWQPLNIPADGRSVISTSRERACRLVEIGSVTFMSDTAFVQALKFVGERLDCTLSRGRFLFEAIQAHEEAYIVSLFDAQRGEFVEVTVDSLVPVFDSDVESENTTPGAQLPLSGVGGSMWPWLLFKACCGVLREKVTDVESVVACLSGVVSSRMVNETIGPMSRLVSGLPLLPDTACVVDEQIRASCMGLKGIEPFIKPFRMWSSDGLDARAPWQGRTQDAEAQSETVNMGALSDRPCISASSAGRHVSRFVLANKQSQSSISFIRTPLNCGLAACVALVASDPSEEVVMNTAESTGAEPLSFPSRTSAPSLVLSVLTDNGWVVIEPNQNETRPSSTSSASWNQLAWKDIHQQHHAVLTFDSPNQAVCVLLKASVIDRATESASTESAEALSVIDARASSVSFLVHSDEPVALFKNLRECLPSDSTGAMETSMAPGCLSGYAYPVVFRLPVVVPDSFAGDTMPESYYCPVSSVNLFPREEHASPERGGTCIRLLSIDSNVEGGPTIASGGMGSRVSWQFHIGNVAYSMSELLDGVVLPQTESCVADSILILARPARSSGPEGSDDSQSGEEPFVFECNFLLTRADHEDQNHPASHGQCVAPRVLRHFELPAPYVIPFYEGRVLQWSSLEAVVSPTVLSSISGENGLSPGETMDMFAITGTSMTRIVTPLQAIQVPSGSRLRSVLVSSSSPDTVATLYAHKALPTAISEYFESDSLVRSSKPDGLSSYLLDSGALTVVGSQGGSSALIVIGTLFTQEMNFLLEIRSSVDLKKDFVWSSEGVFAHSDEPKDSDLNESKENQPTGEEENHDMNVPTPLKAESPGDDTQSLDPMETRQSRYSSGQAQHEPTVRIHVLVDFPSDIPETERTVSVKPDTTVSQVMELFAPSENSGESSEDAKTRNLFLSAPGLEFIETKNENENENDALEGFTASISEIESPSDLSAERDPSSLLDSAGLKSLGAEFDSFSTTVDQYTQRLLDEQSASGISAVEFSASSGKQISERVEYFMGLKEVESIEDCAKVLDSLQSIVLNNSVSAYDKRLAAQIEAVLKVSPLSTIPAEAFDSLSLCMEDAILELGLSVRSAGPFSYYGLLQGAAWILSHFTTEGRPEEEVSDPSNETDEVASDSMGNS